MSPNPKEKPQIDFNDDYDQCLMLTAHARIIISHIKEIYPRVYRGMNHEQIIESYLDPKIRKLIDLEFEYRKQGYPFPQEPALNDLFALINDELQPYEDEEYLKQFDLDIYPIIETEFL
jgi:hypothetical protein